MLCHGLRGGAAADVDDGVCGGSASGEKGNLLVGFIEHGLVAFDDPL